LHIIQTGDREFIFIEEILYVQLEIQRVVIESLLPAKHGVKEEPTIERLHTQLWV